MPTILTHPAAALVAPWFRDLRRSTILLGAIGTILPDLDVIGFKFGIAYGSTFGHRGFTHSILFALIVSALFARRDLKAFAFIFFCAISHPILDAFTDGGRGIAFFSPFSNHRYFFPWRPIRVSPIGAGFFSARGVETLLSEVRWVWVPLGVAGIIGWRTRRAAGSTVPEKAA